MSALISYGIGYSANSTAATSVVIQPPPVYASGDLLVMGVIAGGTGATGGIVPSLPSGWTRVSASGATLATFTKTATGSESPYTVTVASTAASAGFVAAYPAASVVSSSFGGSGTNATSWTGTFPAGVTGTETVLMVCGAVNNGTNTGYQNFNFSSGWTTDVPAFGPALPANPDSVQPVAIGLAEVTGSTGNPTLTSAEGCNLYGGFLVLNVTGKPPVTHQVTATVQAPEAITGMALTVKALTGAASVQAILTGGAAENFYAGAVSQAPAAAITPNATGSIVYGAVAENFDVSGGTSFTANGSTTFTQNVADLLNVAMYGTFESSGTTTASTPVTLGGSAPDNAFTVAALAEILAAPGHSISEVATASVNATYPGQYATTASAQTASFLGTQPQPGQLLVAMVSANSFWQAGNASVTITDSSGLTWTQLAQVQYPAYAGVFVTVVPGPISWQSSPAQAVIPKVFSKGRVYSSRRTAIENPLLGPVFRQATKPARIHPSPPPRGRVSANSGAPVNNPPPPPGPPVVGHVSLAFSTGRTSWNLGAPIQNPTSGPVFYQATRPITAKALPLRHGGYCSITPPYVTPVIPPAPPVFWQFYGHVPVYYLDYLDWTTQETLYCVPGGSYAMVIANSRAGLTIPPSDGRWIPGGSYDIPLRRKIALKLREHIHKSRRRSGYRNPPGE
jgi:hypothetical protein